MSEAQFDQDQLSTQGETQEETQVQETQVEDEACDELIDGLGKLEDEDEDEACDELIDGLGKLDEDEDEACDELIDGLSKLSGNKQVTLKPDPMDILAKVAEYTSQNMNALNAMVVKFGYKLNDDINGVKNDVSNVSMKIDSAVEQMDDKFEKMKAELNDLKSMRKENSMFSSDIGRVIWPKMPLFFDTLRGLYGWFPVNFTDTNDENHDVVVLSVPMVIQLMQSFDGMNNSSLKRDVENHLRSLNRFQISSTERNVNFTRIMTKTPFKAYVMYNVKGGKSRAISFNNNSDNYIVMESKYWQELLSSAKDEFSDRPTCLPEILKPLNKNSMAQQHALKAVSVDNDDTPGIKEFGNVQFSYNERSTWPAMGFPLWREAFGCVQKFFGINMFCHVENGKVRDDVECYTFEETLDAMDDKDRYEEEPEQEEESIVGNKRARDEDWSQDY